MRFLIFDLENNILNFCIKFFFSFLSDSQHFGSHVGGANKNVGCAIKNVG